MTAPLSENPIEVLKLIQAAKYLGVDSVVLTRPVGKALLQVMTNNVGVIGAKYRLFDDGLPWHMLALIEGSPHMKAMIGDVFVYWPAVKTTRGWE